MSGGRSCFVIVMREGREDPVGCFAGQRPPKAAHSATGVRRPAPWLSQCATASVAAASPPLNAHTSDSGSNSGSDSNSDVDECKEGKSRHAPDHRQGMWSMNS